MARESGRRIVPDSGTSEANPPQHGATIVGNIVYGNNNARSPAIEIAELTVGNAVLVAGGNDNVVERNLVYDHDRVGIGVIPLPEKVIHPENKNAQNFDASRNTVRANAVSDSRAADLALVTTIDSATRAGTVSATTARSSRCRPPRDVGPVRTARVTRVRNGHQPIRVAAGLQETGRNRLQDRRAA